MTPPAPSADRRDGLLIDRATPVAFTFEGRPHRGVAGDTIASALAANGEWLLSRSFKYHRPRGILTMAGQDGNTLVQIGDEPNVPADRATIREGLSATGQNYSGSLARDRNAFMEHFARFMPVGFYYKAFFRPRGAWKMWEPVIRARAGLGKVNLEAEHGYFDKAYGFADVAVIGGGPAGMSAALEAATAGAQVWLIDENPVLGGALAYARFGVEAGAAERMRRDLVRAVEAEPDIRVLTDATCQGWFADNWLPVVAGNRLHKLRAREVVVATGAMEQPAIFRNNDLPGIMFGSAAQRLIKLYGVRPGRRAVVLAANPHAYEVALDLLDAGVVVAGIVDLRLDIANGAAVDAVRDAGIPITTGSAIWEAVGKDHVDAVRVAEITGEGACAAPDRSIDCDLLCMSVGYAPAGQLLWHSGARFHYDAATAMHQVDGRQDGLAAAGSVAGAYGYDAVVAEGRVAGWRAAKALGLSVGPEPALPNDRGGAGITHPWPIFPHPKGKDFVDFDEDLQVADINNAVAEGYDDIQLLKRYSTIGMGPSQGRQSNVAAIRLCARATGRDPDAVGTTTARPPVNGEKFGVLAGRTFEPERLTAMHHRHVEAGASLMTAGAWQRPAYYGGEGEREAAIEGEVRAVRTGLGLIDVSTLGGLDIRGPDAAEFMNRLYTWTYTKQQVGRARYVLMCDQSGVVIDDGVACRFHDNHYYVTTTTGGAEQVYRTMLWWNAQWRLRIDVTNATAAYCGVNLAGPKSREALAKVAEGVDLSGEGFPYMGVRTARVAGIPVRMLRVGFVGELGYEIHGPAGQGETLWDALMVAGREFDVRPFGIEAQRVLRLEKGHIIIGQDTDGLTHPYEADMAWAVGEKKPFFVGQRSTGIQMANGISRQLVGFTLPDPEAPTPEECHLVVRGREIVGRVTSAVRSASLGKVIGLAYVAPDQAVPGGRFDIKVAGGRIVEGEVAPTPFYDPENKRQEM